MLHTAPSDVPAAAVRPRAVTHAARAMMASALMGLLSLIVLLFRLDDVRRYLQDATPPPSQAAVDAAVRLTVIGYVAFLVLFPLLTRHVTQGRNWARVAACVLAGLGVVAALTHLGRHQLSLARVFDVLALVLDVSVVLLLLTRPSARFFRPVAQAPFPEA